MREDEAGKSLVRRVAPYGRIIHDGRSERTTVYYMSGVRPVAVISGGRLDKLYGLPEAWGKKLLEVFDLLEGAPGGSREQDDTIEDPVEAVRLVALTSRLLLIVVRPLVLTVFAAVYASWQRLKFSMGVTR